MSTVKNPKEKKRLSLSRDRRNVYGENAKSSRKNIPRGKQLRHMDERRGAAEVLARLKGSELDEQELAAAESTVADRILQSRRRGFKKQPDEPLGKVLQNKETRKRNSKLVTSIVTPH